MKQDEIIGFPKQVKFFNLGGMTDKELLQKYLDYYLNRETAATYLLGAYDAWEKNDEHDTWYALILWGHYKTQCNHILDSLNYRDYERLCDLAGSIV